MKELTEAAGKKESISLSNTILALLVIAVLIGKLLLLPSIPVGQDEFNNLSKIYDYERSELSTPWQSIHVHFFRWLPIAGANEVDQITAARTVMFLCLIGTVVFLYLLARRFLSIGGSLFSALCYLSLASTIANGASFRTDTPAIILIMFSLWLFVARSRSMPANVLSGLALALAVLCTIKTGFYLLVFAALLLFRLRRSRDGRLGGSRVASSAWFAGALCGGFVTLFYFHNASMASVQASQAGKIIARSYSTFIDLTQFFPGFEYFRMALRSNPLIWLIFAGGLFIHIVDLCVRIDSRETPRPYLWVFTLPLLSFLVYRNTFPYFYVFIMPCALIFCGYAADRLVLFSKELHPRLSRVLMGFLALTISLIAVLRIVSFYIYLPAFTARQRELLTVVHRIFPEPVAYLDGCRMVSSFPNAGFFMSSAGMRGYLQGNTPSLRNRIMNREPLFVLDDVPHLNISSPGPTESAYGFTLRRDDWEALRSHYVHHWGPLWIMGKHFALMDGNQKQSFDIVAGGLYTVESEADVFLDGTLYHNGTVLRLAQGKHTIEAKTDGVIVTLRWGDHLYRPTSLLSWQDLFMGPFA